MKQEPSFTGEPSHEAALSDEKYVEATRQAELRLNEIQLEDARLTQIQLVELDKQLRAEMASHEATRVELERSLIDGQTLQAERRAFLEQIRIEESKERKMLEADLKKMEVDLQRIRATRDSLQRNLDERVARDEAREKALEECVSLAQTRKDRIALLETQLQRLKMSIAAGIGEQSLLDFFDESPDGNPYKILRDRLSHAEEQIKIFDDMNADCPPDDIVPQLSTLLKTKTELVEQEADAKRRMQEQIDLLKKRLDSITSKESPAEAQLLRQIDDYKLLLKCQSCNNNFKSHVLLKCMHTFCKGCIDNAYNSRQRKCPTCQTAFGLQDIKQVYL
eukprot:jgi/Hompol1/6532/HPOL_000185-RA